jgi:hypothetical protein
MNHPPRLACSCRCDRPVLDGESCLRCGRTLVRLPEPSGKPPARPAHDWTCASVIRALRAFAFFRGRHPVDADWAGRMGDDWPALEDVLRLFGSVEAAVDLAARR